MRLKRTFSVLLLLALACGFYFLKLYKPGSFNPSQNLVFARPRILELKKEEFVRWFSVQNKDAQPIEFEISSRGWSIISPVFSRAETVLADGFIILMKQTFRFRNLSLNEMDERDLGFNDSQLSVCIETNLSIQPRCLRVGKPSAIGKGFYARWSDEPNFFHCRSGVYEGV